MWHHIPEDSNPHSCHLENIRSQKGYYFSQYVAYCLLFTLSLFSPPPNALKQYVYGSVIFNLEHHVLTARSYEQ
jgi:hypothetical protein